MSEKAVVAKVEELMKSLDQVRRYRALARFLVDFLIIILFSVAVLFVLEIAVNFYHLTSSFPNYFALPSTLVIVSSAGSTSPILQLLLVLSLILIPAVGLLTGIFWVNHKMKAVEGESWRKTLNEGFPGALKLLQALDWDSVINDIRISKIGYVLYFVVKVVGYWALSIIILFFPYGFGISLLHVNVNWYFLAFISLALVLILSRKDLQKRYRQVVSLDTLMWELRWFNSEFKSAEFQA
jgi:hypothetical protein